MREFVSKIIETVEPLEDPIYGPMYRCSLTLKDGLLLPCAVLQSKSRLVDLAKRRISKEAGGKGILRGPGPHGQILASFVASGNRVSDYDVAAATPSRFAIPLDLLRKIEGETTMSWTGWDFRMRDGSPFAYGSTFLMEFFHLPDGYEFEDVVEVINHSHLESSDAVVKLTEGGEPLQGYPSKSLLRERPYFSCAVEGI